MALTQAIVGRVDVPPQLAGLPGQPLDTGLWTVDLTLGATSDYGATGIDLTSSVIIGSGATGINAGQIAAVVSADVRSSTGVLRPYTSRFDATNKTLRLFRGSSAVFTNAVQLLNTAGTETAPLAANAYTLPANTLSANGMGLRATFWGSKLTTAEISTVRVNLGGTVANPPVGGTILATLLTNNTATVSGWRITLEMIRRTSATQSIITTGIVSQDNLFVVTDKDVQAKTTIGSADFTTALTLLPTVNSTTGSAISLEGQIVELIQAGTNAAPGGGNLIEIVPGTDLVAGDIVRLTLVVV